MLPSNSTETIPVMVDHDDMGPLIIGITTMMMVLSALCVALRFWVRSQRGVKLGADDILTVLASMMFATEIVAPFVITFVKCSILAMYWRIFPTRFMKFSCIVMAVIIWLWNLAYVLGAVLQCNPVSKAWEPTMTTGSCNSGLADWLGWAATVPEFATDVVLIALPIYETSRLQTSLASKIAISSAFAVGVLTLVSAIIRLWTALGITRLTPILRFLVHVAYIQLWCFIEGTMGLICACLPTMRPLLNIFTKKGSLSSVVSGKTPPSQYNSRTGQGSRGAINSTPRTRGSFERLPDVDHANKAWLWESDPEHWNVLRSSPSGNYGDQVPLKEITVTQRVTANGTDEPWPLHTVRVQSGCK
ncbi:hypothetical protein GQ53DRAFT_730904 [Thozetella sp. PMI_491]|nr:hypothetical protein GQ53DRAFT_730904 [Thozetella sp. PMI_491]